MKPKRRLDFENLPLVEAAVRASFKGPTALSYRLVNSIAAELQPSFPILSESKQLEVAPGAGVVDLAFGPGYLPGAVYAGHTAGLSVHVQPQVIVARWSKQPGSTEPEYPRYQTLCDSLWTAVEAFRKACGDEYPGIAVINMSYVNFVPTEDARGFLTTYFSQDAQLRTMDGAQQVQKLEAAWSEGDNLDVRFAVERAAAKLLGGATPGYRLTTAAGLRLGESVNAKAGLETVHDALQDFFLRLISDHAKREWKLQETPSA